MTKTEKFRRLAVVFVIIISGISLLFTGCGNGDDTPIEIDINAVANSIHESVEFEDELILLDSEAVKYLYGIDDSISAAVYSGSGATAEEVAVFDAGTAEVGEAMLQTVQKHVDEQIESFKNYVPTEIPKLEDAVIVREGRYVILCVAEDDETAKSVINEAVGK